MVIDGDWWFDAYFVNICETHHYSRGWWCLTTQAVFGLFEEVHFGRVTQSAAAGLNGQ